MPNDRTARNSPQRTISFENEGSANHINVDNISFFAVTDEEPTDVARKIALIAPLVVMTVVAIVIDTSGGFFGFLVLVGILTFMSWAAMASLDRERAEIATLSTTYASTLSGVSGGDTGSHDVLDIEDQFLTSVPEKITIENETKNPMLNSYYRIHFVPDNIVSIRSGEDCSSYCLLLMGLALISGLGALLSLLTIQLLNFLVLLVLGAASFFLGSYFAKIGVEISLQGEEARFFRMNEVDASRLVDRFSSRSGSDGTVRGQQRP